MDPKTSGRRPRSLVALIIAMLTALSVLQPTAAMAVDTAPALVSLERISPDVVVEGDEVVVAWEFDAPVESVTVTLRDALGAIQYLYGGWDGGQSGEARGTVDTTMWSGGAVALDGLSYSWSAGDTYHYVDLDAQGEVRWSSDGLAPIAPAGDAIRYASFVVESDVDLSIPPALLTATRVSADTLVDGERVEVAWEFDRPIDSVTFSFRDSFGREHRAEWSSWYDVGGPATAGSVGLEVETPSWAGGDVVFAELTYRWNGGLMTIDASGHVVYKSPDGLADAGLPQGGLDALDFTVISDHDPSAVPVLTALARTSADTVREGDEILLDWGVDGVVDSFSVTLRDALGGSHYLYGDAWGGATSGQIRSYVDTTEWPAGTVELERIEYSWIGTGGVNSSVALDASGQVLWSTDDAAVAASPDVIAFTPFTVESDVDLSVPPSLTGLARTSADMLGEGEELRISWSTDRPVESVQVTFRDAVGRSHLADWSMWRDGTGPATEGSAIAVIDTTQWAGGEVVLDRLSYGWGAGSITIDASGDILSKDPSALQDPTVPLAELAALTFAIDSDLDLAAVPSLTSVSRMSADIIRDGEAPAIAWETDRPLQWIGFLYFDGLGRQQVLVWNGEPATSGTASVTLEGATWAPGVAELVQVRYSAPGDSSVVLDRDGSVVSKSPAGIDDPGAYGPGFSSLEFTVDTDAVFETVTVPEPVFTSATCDAPAHLLLEDFPHGWWSWGPGGDGFGGFGEEFDGEPWLPVEGAVFTVTAVFEDGWGTTGESQWTHVYTDPGSCEALLELEAAPTPTLVGEPVVGETLTAVAGDWQPAPVELGFQWLRDGVPIVGAVESAHVLTAADAGAAISVEITGTKDGYVPISRASEPVSIAKPAPTVTRIAGDGGVGTYARASASTWSSGVDVAYIVNGSDRASGAAAALLAGTVGGPLLAAKHGSVPDETAVELARLAPGRIVVIGGADRVSETVVDELARFTDGAVERISGDDDAGLLAAVSVDRNGAGIDAAYVVDPSDSPTSLAAAALAAAHGAPLLAVASDDVPAATAAELDRLGARRIVVIGTADAVSDSVVDALGAFTTGTVERLDAAGRLGTVAAISADGWPTGADAVYVVNGSDKAALAAGAALSASAGAPLLAVKRSSVTSEIRAEIERLAPARVVVLGDTNAVDGSVLAELSGLVGAAAAGS